MKLNRRSLRKLIIKEMMGPMAPSDYLKPHLKKHGKYGTDRDGISSPYDEFGDVVGTSDYGGRYEDYRDWTDSDLYDDWREQFDAEDSDADPNDIDSQMYGRALDSLEDEGFLTDHGKKGSEGYEFHGRHMSDEELGLVDSKGKSQLYERKMLRKMILKEMRMLGVPL